jgi:Protein of unknown function DUF2625
MIRPLRELVEVEDPAWPLIQAWITASTVPVQVPPMERVEGEAELGAVQVTLHSILGSLAYHTGGLLLDWGWLKILGAASKACPWSISSLTASLGWARDENPPSAVAVGLDVLGGVFAINGGAIGNASVGHVCYYDPVSLSWGDLGLPHSSWVACMLDRARLNKFYKDLRWPGWELETKALNAEHGISIAPPLWAKESRPLVRTSRRPVPLDELIGLNFDLGRQLGQ